MKNPSSLSTEAKRVIISRKPSSDSEKYLEYLHHDGHDKEGPKSDLWEFFIMDKTNDFFIQWYHREYWYSGGDHEPYYLLEEGGQDLLSRLQTIFPSLFQDT